MYWPTTTLLKSLLTLDDDLIIDPTDITALQQDGKITNILFKNGKERVAFMSVEELMEKLQTWSEGISKRLADEQV